MLIELALLLTIGFFGVWSAIRRGRRRFLAASYSAFTIFEHVALPWVLFVVLGGVGYFLTTYVGVDGEVWLAAAGILALFGLVLTSFAFPPALVLLLLFLSPSLLYATIEAKVIILFALKAVWILLAAGAMGNTIALLRAEK